MDRWEYLITKEYCLRHHIVEYFIKDYSTVIDVGTYKKTLNFSGTLYSIDPLKSLPNTYHGTIGEWYLEYGKIISNNNYAVVVLGLDIEGNQNELDTLITLILNSKLTVLEFASEFSNSVNQFHNIMHTAQKKIGHCIDIKFPHVDTPGFVPYNSRKIYTLIS